jgi:hypothetical protein
VQEFKNQLLFQPVLFFFNKRGSIPVIKEIAKDKFVKECT